MSATAMTLDAPLKIEIFADVTCLWCYIGKRKLEAAFDLFARRDDIDVLRSEIEISRTLIKQAPFLIFAEDIVVLGGQSEEELKRALPRPSPNLREAIFKGRKRLPPEPTDGSGIDAEPCMSQSLHETADDIDEAAAPGNCAMAQRTKRACD